MQLTGKEDQRFLFKQFCGHQRIYNIHSKQMCIVKNFSKGGFYHILCNIHRIRAIWLETFKEPNGLLQLWQPHLL